MPIYNKAAPGLEEVDVIICGGGLTACVVAGRLAEADPNLSILLIEGGENNANNDSSRHPAMYPQNLVPTSKNSVWYQAKKSEHIAGREYALPTGGMLGGGSSINIMLYSRPVHGDFDSWKTPGWSDKEMLPYLRKLETYHGEGDPIVHGNGGPLHVTKGKYRGWRSQSDYLAAAKSVGFPVVTDLHDMKPGRMGIEIAHKTVSEDGFRVDAATAYVHPLLKDGSHENLHVLCGSKVIKVLFDAHKRAIGVKYIANPQLFDGEPVDQSRHVVRARKMTILSCGALGSPLLLERSGIGSQEVLKKASVPVVVDLPGVGEQYQDHTLVLWHYKTNLVAGETLDALWQGRMTPSDADFENLLSWNSCDTHGKLRPSDKEVAALGPAFKAVWDKEFKDKPSRPFMIQAGLAAYIGDPSAVEPGQYYTIASYSAYPYSRGSIHITGPCLEDPPDFDTGFLDQGGDFDLKQHTWAYKRIREIMRRTDMYRGEVAHEHPKFASDKAAVQSLEHSLSSHGEVQDLKYSAGDDQAIEQCIREKVATTWHSLGTCSMKPREIGGVVNSDLNVYGTTGLKVIDLSIPPQNVAANTQITAYSIGEKGADIVLKELGAMKG